VAVRWWWNGVWVVGFGYEGDERTMREAVQCRRKWGKRGEG
jgi:hypothetical protein